MNFRFMKKMAFILGVLGTSVPGKAVLVYIWEVGKLFKSSGYTPRAGDKAAFFPRTGGDLLSLGRDNDSSRLAVSLESDSLFTRERCVKKVNDINDTENIRALQELSTLLMVGDGAVVPIEGKCYEVEIHETKKLKCFTSDFLKISCLLHRRTKDEQTALLEDVLLVIYTGNPGDPTIAPRQYLLRHTNDCTRLYNTPSHPKTNKKKYYVQSNPSS